MDNFKYKYNVLNEQSAVLSDDPKQRIVQYLEDEDLLEKLASVIKDLAPNDKVEFEDLGISKSDFGIREGDEVYVQRLSSTDKPKFSIYVYNKAQAMIDVDLENAAFILHRAAKGLGTDEESIAAVAGGLIKIASDKNIDPNDVFNELEKIYQAKYGESLKDMIEGEFSGRAEVAALNAFRLKIDDSVLRSLNMGTILADLALTILSFGGGTAISASLKGARAGSRTWQYLKGADKLNKLGKLGKIGSKIPVIGKLIQSWNGMSKAMKIARLNRLAKSGKPLQYIGGKGGKPVLEYIAKIERGRVYWRGSLGGARPGPSVSNLVSHGGLSLTPSSLAMLVPGNAKKIAAGASVGTRLDTVGSDADFFEIMGWYDSLAKNPESYVEDVKTEGSDKLAETLLMLKDGSGIFGNTTDQEELQIALILTSINSETARKVETEYQRKGEGTVSELINDELGGDLATITSAVWAGLIGAEGSSSVKYADKLLKQKEAK